MTLGTDSGRTTASFRFSRTKGRPCGGPFCVSALRGRCFSQRSEAKIDRQHDRAAALGAHVPGSLHHRTIAIGP